MDNQQHMQPMPTAAKNEWLHGILDCFDPISTCLLGNFLPCVLYGRVSHRMKKELDAKSWSPFNGDCCGWYCLGCCGCQFIIQMMTRGELRERYNLSGNGGVDVALACCIPCCDLIQMDKELAGRAAAGNVIATQPEKAPEGMTYGAPTPQQPAPAYDPHMGATSPPVTQPAIGYESHAPMQQPTYTDSVSPAPIVNNGYAADHKQPL